MHNNHWEYGFGSAGKQQKDRAPNVGILFYALTLVLRALELPHRLLL